jgi:hypothetical protein
VSLDGLRPSGPHRPDGRTRTQDLTPCDGPFESDSGLVSLRLTPAGAADTTIRCVTLTLTPRGLFYVRPRVDNFS